MKIVNVLAAALDARATVTRATKLRIAAILDEQSRRNQEAKCLPKIALSAHRFLFCARQTYCACAHALQNAKRAREALP